MIARTYEKIGRLMEARDVYRLIATEELAHYAPSAFFEAQAAATKEMTELESRIPGIYVEVKGVDRRLVTVTVDGAVEDFSKPILRNPGIKISVIVSAPGRRPVAQEAIMEEGAIIPMMFDMSIRRSDAMTVAGPESPSENARRELPSGPNKIMVGAGIIVSSALVATGIGLIVAGNASVDLDQSGAMTSGAVAACIGGGVVGAATVTYVILAAPSSSGIASGLHLRGWVGVEGIGVTGTW